MAAPVIGFKGLGITFGGKPLFQNLEGYINLGERYCLIGRNGCGKSTLLKLLAGSVESDHGEIFIQPGLKIHFLSQDPKFTGYTTALDYVMSQKIEQYEAEEFLMHVQIPTDLALKSASGGELRRCALAHTLAGNPDVLLLDEPTNHMDLPTIEWLEGYLNQFKGALLVISHDRRFLANTTNKTYWLDRGKLRYHDQGFKDYERWSEQVLADDERHMEKLNTKLKQEEEWLHRGVTGRRRRNQGRLRALLKLREIKTDTQRLRKKEMAQQGMSASSSSKLVIRATDISKAFGNRILIKPFSIDIEKGDRLGIIGPNGAGKTTLAQMLVKKIPPDQGKVYIGPKTELIYFDQMRDSLDPNKSMWQNLTDGNYVTVQGVDVHVMGYLKGFMFNHEQIRGIVGILSGGEKNRLALAKALCQQGNLLVLDEPTNDLDMDTLDMLQELLCDYPGTLIIISHDRDFLDRLTTSVLVMDGSGKVEEFIGGYSDTVKRPPSSSSRKRGSISSNDTGSHSPNLINGSSVSCASHLAEDDRQKKTSFKHKHAFEQMSLQVTALENKIQDLEYQLEESDLFSKNPEKFQKLSSELVVTQAALVAAEEAWFVLAGA